MKSEKKCLTLSIENKQLRKKQISNNNNNSKDISLSQSIIEPKDKQNEIDKIEGELIIKDPDAIKKKIDGLMLELNKWVEKYDKALNIKKPTNRSESRGRKITIKKQKNV